MLLQKAAALCFVGCSLVLARSLPGNIHPRQDASPTTDVPAAQSTKCGEIINAVNEGFSIFAASDAYQCLNSTPFNPAVASRFLKYWNETIQFQSTLAYLKNPPQGYQQPAVDVLDELQQIQQRINTGFYKNQYAFEADFQLLTFALNDGHVALVSGALSAFTFASPFEIASVSIDGKEPPKVYFTADIIDSQKQGWTPSPIKSINGEDTTEFLTKFAALNAGGYVEPHAEWNALMSSPSLDILGGNTIFSGGATFYPGENISVQFENYTEGDPSTEWADIWVAFYNELANYTGPLATGGDFYNYFVLGLLPASFDPLTIAPPLLSEPEPATMNWNAASFGAFPENPDIVQDDLGPLHKGLVSGYFYDDISTGVLSLPSFDAFSDSIGNYTATINDFIIKASEKGLKKIIIDLQRNGGGATLLAYTTFKSLFPDLTPFGGSRRRVFPQADTLGSAYTKFWESLNEKNPDDLLFKQDIAANEWVITNRINAANGKNFTGWDEYQGPVNDNGDTFSMTQQYDLANPVFDQAAFDQWLPTMYLDNKSDWPITERLFNPDQVVLLTDGLCASACSLFVEMMTRAGVKTIVAGGRPQNGPMQAASGNRGAAVYGMDDLDFDIGFARSVDDLVDDNVNASLPDIRESGIFVNFASVNLRDQVRKDEKIPLQFKYEAADCRVYYTMQNLYNTTRLWHDIAAAFEDSSLCVEGSTGYSTTNNTAPSPPPLNPGSERPTLNKDNPVIEQVEFEEDPTGGLRDDVSRTFRAPRVPSLCRADLFDGDPCSRDGQSRCKQIPIYCPGAGSLMINACLPPCDCPLGGACNSCAGQCNIFDVQESKSTVSGFPATAPQGRFVHGVCFPSIGNTRLGCPSNPPPGSLPPGIAPAVNPKAGVAPAVSPSLGVPPTTNPAAGRLPAGRRPAGVPVAGVPAQGVPAAGVPAGASRPGAARPPGKGGFA